MSIKPLVVIVGQTASGKSSVAMELAKLHNGEIIAADSRTIYKHMDIGTAKPTQQDQKDVKHWGINLVEPCQKYSAAEFQTYANKAIKDIQKRQKVPFLVGGSGLYINSIIYDYNFGVQVDEQKRSYLHNKTTTELVDLARETGVEISQSTSKNRRHLIRIIERNGHEQINNVIRPHILVVGLDIPKNQLRVKIEQRTEQMFRAGLRKEVDELFNKYDENCESFSGNVYDLFRMYNRGEIASISSLKRKTVSRDVQLAKRQKTWFKRNRDIEWFSGPKPLMNRVDEYLASNSYT